METLVAYDPGFSIEWSEDRGQVKIDSVWLVNGEHEVEVTQVIGDDAMAYFYRQLEEDQIAAAEMMDDEPPFKTNPLLAGGGK